MRDLNEMLIPGQGQGWILETAYDINNNGLIVGRAYFDAGGGNYESRAFLLTPTPEPASLLLITVGAMIINRRRRSDR